MFRNFFLTLAFVAVIIGVPADSQTRDVFRDENSGISLTYDPRAWVVLEPSDEVTVIMLGGFLEEGSQTLWRSCSAMSKPFPEGVAAPTFIDDLRSKMDAGGAEAFSQSAARSFTSSGYSVEDISVRLEPGGDYPATYLTSQVHAINDPTQEAIEIVSKQLYTAEAVNVVRCEMLLGPSSANADLKAGRREADQILASFGLTSKNRLPEGSNSYSSEQLLHMVGRFIGYAIGLIVLFLGARSFLRRKTR